MLSLWLVAVLVAGAHAKCYEANGTGLNYVSSDVTLNERRQPYWYQAQFDDCIDGDIFEDLTIETIRVNAASPYGIFEISDFPDVVEINLSNLDLEKHPKMFNMPQITEMLLNGNRFTSIEQGYYDKVPVKRLLFRSNQISDIRKGSFGAELQYLSLLCNNLTTISSDWFTGKSKLEYLSLAGNKISAIPDNYLNGFVNLKELILRNNQILKVGDRAFVGAKNLQTLTLNYNNITELKASSFPPEGLHMELFQIEYNRLSFLTEEMMSRVVSESIKIWGNPWQCPCLVSIKIWQLSNTTDSYKTLPREYDPNCVVAAAFSQYCVPFVEEELYEIFAESFKFKPSEIC